MPISSVFETTIERLSILEPDGTFDESLGKDLIPDEDLVDLYRHMMMCRQFDVIAFKLQRSGRMGTYPENRGQEATSLGAAYVLEKSDWLVPCYRGATTSIPICTSHPWPFRSEHRCSMP